MPQSPLEDIDTFESVQWEEVPPTLSTQNSSSSPLGGYADQTLAGGLTDPRHRSVHGAPANKGKGRESSTPTATSSGVDGTSTDRSGAGAGDEGSQWDGWVEARIVDYKKEIVDGKESHVTFGVHTRVSSGWRDP